MTTLRCRLLGHPWRVRRTAFFGECRRCYDERRRPLVEAPTPAAMAVVIDGTEHTIDHGHPAYPRLDLVASRQTLAGRKYRVFTGVASAAPVAPPLPLNYQAVAELHIPAVAGCISRLDIHPPRSS